VDKTLPVYDVISGASFYAETISPKRVSTILGVCFSALGLFMAVLGIYGVASYAVSQRTHEIGIRMALGAQPGHILRWILRQGILLVLLGVAIGLAGAVALTRFMSSLLSEVEATDPVTFAGVAFLLAAVALLACYIPARRATKVDPMVALRCE
jgi:putative ABC transport system permease protein